MPQRNVTALPQRAQLTTPSAPAMSRADRDAHAASSYVRPDAGWFPTAAADGDSDPDMDEALRRTRGDVYDAVSPQATAVLNRVTTNVAYLLRDLAEVA